MKSVRDIVGIRRTFEETKQGVYDSVGMDAYWAGVRQLTEVVVFNRATHMVKFQIFPNMLFSGFDILP